MDIQAFSKNDVRVATERKTELVVLCVKIAKDSDAVKIDDDFTEFVGFQEISNARILFCPLLGHLIKLREGESLLEPE